MKTRKAFVTLCALWLVFGLTIAASAYPLPHDMSGYYKFGYFDGAEHAAKVEMGVGSITVYVLPNMDPYLGIIVGDEIFFKEDPLRWAVLRAVSDTVALFAIHDEETGEISEFSSVKITEEEANEIAERDRLAQLDGECVANLKRLGLALHQFAAEHENEFPLNLSELYPDYVSDQMVFVCPLRGGEFRYFDQDYEYIPGFCLGSPNPDQEAVMIEAEGNHSGFHHVLYLDGHVESVPDDAY